MITGRGRMQLDAQEFDVGPGHVIINRPGGSHALRNVGDSDLRLVVSRCQRMNHRSSVKTVSRRASKKGCGLRSSARHSTETRSSGCCSNVSVFQTARRRRFSPSTFHDRPLAWWRSTTGVFCSCANIGSLSTSWCGPSFGRHSRRGDGTAGRGKRAKEETGYHAGRLRRLQSFYASYGCGNQVFEVFLAEGLVHTTDVFDRNEVMALRWFTRQKLKSLIVRNGIVDGLSLAPLLLLLLQAPASRSRVRSRRLRPPVATT